jgi:type IV secretory pathway VirB10-like protein
MKNIRHNKIRNTAIAIVALAGLAVATTACFGNSSKDSASQALDATIEAVSDQPEDAAKSTPTSTVSRVTTEVESATPATAAPAAAEPAPETEAAPATEGFETETASPEAAPETETAPSTEAPATTTPATASPSIPALALSPTIVFVTFDQDGTNVNTSIVVEEAGLGRNDIVSVEFTYTKFGTERTVTATKASSTTTSSLWLVESLMLPVGSTVKIHAVDARGNSDDITKTVVLSTAMG